MNGRPVLERCDQLACAVNVSEGRDRAVLEQLAHAAGGNLLDVHADPHHNRSVLTLGGPAPEVVDAAYELARVAVARLDLRRHEGVHPRFGVVDVVPFTPLDPDGSPHPDLSLDVALRARERFARACGEQLGVPCFYYGPERDLPTVRRLAFSPLLPDWGPHRPHPTAGATAVGARGPLIAYNVWLDSTDLVLAQRIAKAIRASGLRALGLPVGRYVQVSCNLTEPFRQRPDVVFDHVEALTRAEGVRVLRAELVGLAPAAVVNAIPPERRQQLDLDEERTIEARLKARRQAPL
jgi:glutamate formiminotransferase